MPGKVIYVVYNKRGATTARALRVALQEEMPGFSVRRTSKGVFKRNPDLIVRWGDSTTPFEGPQLNEGKHVRAASDKLKMIQALDECKEVKIPKMARPNDYKEVVDENGLAFFRNEHNQIRLRQKPVAGDKYALSPIKKTNEYRIHVFNDKVVGVYEKIPYDKETQIFKNDTCEFKRLDMANDQHRNYIKGARGMAKAAVKSLNLLFGGVDVVRDERGRFFILEVNSAPSLNEPNIERWTKIIKDYIVNNVKEL